MKTIKDLEKEYENFKTEAINYLKTMEDLEMHLVISIQDTENIEQELINEKEANKKRKISGKIRNLFSIILDEKEELSFYDEDNNILDEIIELTIKQKEFYTQVINIITLENYQKLIKLISFGIEWYNRHIDYFEARRDALECAYKGFNYTSSKTEDNREVIAEFLTNKINELSTGKSLEKSKKMC